MTWAEICERYPNQWVSLCDVDRGDDPDVRLRTARVVPSPAGVVPQEILDLYPDPPDAAPCFTGTFDAERWRGWKMDRLRAHLAARGASR